MRRRGKTKVLTELNVYEPMRENDVLDNVEGFEDNPQPCLMLLTHTALNTRSTQKVDEGFRITHNLVTQDYCLTSCLS